MNTIQVTTKEPKVITFNDIKLGEFFTAYNLYHHRRMLYLKTSQEVLQFINGYFEFYDTLDRFQHHGTTNTDLRKAEVDMNVRELT